MTTAIPNPPQIATREEWLAARKELLQQEKELTRQRDAVNAARRRLPMVRVEKDYVFQTPDGPRRLIDLFEGRPQLIVYHFMFDPEWEQGCPSCSWLVDNIGHLSHLHARNTTLVLISRAPLEKILPFKARMGWTVPWVSSFGSEFNYDFHVTMDEKVAPVEYNYRSKAELLARGEVFFTDGESHGVSVFLREGDGAFRSYSAYARGAEILLGTYNWLDLTPLGRQEDWEEPAGRSDGPFMHWVRHHDRYEDARQADRCREHSHSAEEQAMTQGAAEGLVPVRHRAQGRTQLPGAAPPGFRGHGPARAGEAVALRPGGLAPGRVRHRFPGRRQIPLCLAQQGEGRHGHGRHLQGDRRARAHRPYRAVRPGLDRGRDGAGHALRRAGRAHDGDRHGAVFVQAGARGRAQDGDDRRLGRGL
jgi:predicted dithiol-disulfide oxidoreductase (DUF899 family)